MNERIMELAMQAADGMLSYDAEGEFRLNQQEVFKFAELLLQECIDLANHSNVTGVSVIGERIKEHFGIEE
jgi:hypothetical protein